MKFSIIIPCRDDSAGLDRAVASVLGQTVRDLEVIVVDDGSDPPIAAISDPRVRLVRRETAGGPAIARNVGLAVADGEIVGWCDSDDSFTPNRLELALDLHRDADIVVVGQGRATHPTTVAQVPASLDRVLDRFNPHLGATTVRRERCLMLDDRFLACEDVEWWIRTIASGSSFRSVADVGYLVGSDDRVRVLNSPTARLDFSYSLLDLHAEFYDHHHGPQAFRWMRIAAMERNEGNYSLARRALSHSMRARPTTLAAKEAVRLARAILAGQTPPLSILPGPLPPLSPIRARALLPLVRGTIESRQSFGPMILNRTASISSRLPRPIRGRMRRAASLLADSDSLCANTAWGALPIRANEVRLLAPYADEPFEVALLARYLQPGMTAIDVGANRGSYSLMFSARVGATGRVVAVEPDPRMLQRLNEVRHINKLEGTLEIVESAIAGESGQRELNLNAEPALNYLAPMTGQTPDGRFTEVTVMSYSDLLARQGLDRVDLLKADVEGAEPEVLASVVKCENDALLPRWIMFEYEPAHWARLGHSSFRPIAEALSGTYDLFAIDYASGRLLPINEFDMPAWTGRNAIAVHREESGESLQRVLAHLV